MLEDKFDATMAFIRKLDGHADVCDKEAKRNADRKKSWVKQSNLLRKYLLECLITSKQDSLTTSLNTFTARKASVKLVVYDVDLLPDEMVDVQSITDVISTPKMEVTRQRLSLDEWKAIYIAAEQHPPYLQCAMLLALVTGQRIGDISNMKFTDIWDDMLHITQEKTGSRLAIPLDLVCGPTNLSLRKVVVKCRDAVLSKYLVHFRHTTSQAIRGDSVSANAITTTFKKARNRSGITWPEGTAPTFHEQRSLSERLYREQGLETQKLLGHKTQKMTDKYNDDRGKKWMVIAI
ncbi:tyrosine-type recombinase/integrase [Yersinia pekkanenii]|uniref:Integrase n=1 Tax=Yersinia pekkanenii TaxID=1288385 RepID=A0ABM9TWM3_9GAMM|nr:tyrosine-type recombinase/integrase [Yersinia pekkanenii]CRY64311.1 integrase [Yersinia pekkanenii]